LAGTARWRRKQKHDRRDAELILKLLVEKRFPAIWIPSQELLDLRALVLHRHHWVHCRIAMETGTHSPWVSRLLTALGHEVIVWMRAL
jgi:transposase